MDKLLAVGASLIGLAWIPVLLKFYRAWRARRNPISLAICGLVVFCLYIDLAPFLFFTTSAQWVVTVLVGLNALGCAHFYYSFYAAKKRFQDDRH